MTGQGLSVWSVPPAVADSDRRHSTGKEKGGPEGPPFKAKRVPCAYQVPPLQPLVPPEQVRLETPVVAFFTMLNVPPDFECAVTV
jgi:hypothetical protein